MTSGRRQFFLTALAASALATRNQAQTNDEWGCPVVDIHLHSRKDPESVYQHIQGSGVTRAILLMRADREQEANDAITKYPGRFFRFLSADATKPGAIETLRTAARSGALGFGELKDHTALDSNEMKQVYTLAAEFHLPVLMHFQEVGGDGGYNTGFTRFRAILKAFPRTTFIGHGDFFWANISADEPTGVSYPTGPVKPGGLTDRMLSDFPNLYGDLSANSGRNSLARDEGFSRDFLKRHREKLMFGSDCPCLDGHGKGQVSTAPLIRNRCVARETLAALKQLADPGLFRSIASGNVTRLLKLSA